MLYFQGFKTEEQLNPIGMTKITKIETTNDKISGRGGITFFMRSIQQTGFFGIVLSVLGFVSLSGKGLSLYFIRFRFGLFDGCKVVNFIICFTRM